MTDREWMECEEPLALLRYVEGQAGRRRSRLLAAACCRRVWHLLREDRSHRAVEAAELYADRAIDKWGRERAEQAAFKAYDFEQGPADPAARTAARMAWQSVSKVFSMGQLLASACIAAGIEEERRHQLLLVRDIFGNPFRPFSVSPHLQSPSVLSLAEAAYDDRALPSGALRNERLLVLADGLEEAGCDDAELLSHLRSAGPHVRGCAAVDAVLGRS